MISEGQKVTTENLNSVMEFDHCIEVKADGTVADRNDIYSEMFEVTSVLKDADAFLWETEVSLPEGWRLMNGYSGQDRYSGPEMHVSEFIGGRMARDILETPGTYIALEVRPDCGGTQEGCSVEDGCYCQPDGWVVAMKESE